MAWRLSLAGSEAARGRCAAAQADARSGKVCCLGSGIGQNGGFGSCLVYFALEGIRQQRPGVSRRRSHLVGWQKHVTGKLLST